jgi:SAM-dependent methyltransferase
MRLSAISDPFAALATDCEELSVRLQCPRCRANMNGLNCPRCAFQLQNNDGIMLALTPERTAHYARFIEDYERIREAEGRGGDSDDFYLNLPYMDVSDRNSNQWRIRARSFDHLLEYVLRPHLNGRPGRILDLGAGNCWMSFRLELAGFHPYSVDLLINDRDGLGAARHYRKHVPALFPRFQAEFTRLPFQNDQFDAAVFNASFHYVEDYEAALREAFRCISDGGMVVISDTPWYSREESGRQMVCERHAAFLARYGTASDSIRSLEYLTDQRLRDLAERLSIQWITVYPRYGFKWTMRPLVAKLLNRREPSRFRIYVARKALA